MSSLPSSYNSLPYRDIRVSHVPSSFPTPTPVILVTLYRPATNNAFTNDSMSGELEQSFNLPRLIGYSKAMHLITTGAVYPSTSPLLSELFSEIVEPEEVLPRALEIADEIAKNTSTVSTHVMKDMIWRGPETSEETQLL